MKVMGPLGLMELLENEMANQEEDRVREERKAQATAKVTLALGTRDLTDTQKRLVDEVHHREQTGLSNQIGGFSIPFEHRRPNLK